MNRTFAPLSGICQAVTTHPADYSMGDVDKANVRDGKALWFRGELLAKLRLLSKTFADTEFFVFLVARKESPYLIEELVMPEQFANSSAVLAPGRAVLRANREARAMGGLIVCAAHSHASMSVFSSSIDVEFMRQLADEGTGWSAYKSLTSQGQVVAESAGGDADPSAPLVFDVQFPERPEFSLRIAANNHCDLSAADLSASLTYHEPIQTSAFLTVNAAGDRFMPLFRATRCPLCSATTREETTTDTDIHVIGAEAIGHAERGALLAMAERRAPRRSVPTYTTYGSKNWQSPETAPPFYNKYIDQTSNGDRSKSSTVFVVSRHGMSQRISAEIMEEAAFLCPRLAEALGWQDDAATANRTHDSVREPMDRQDDRTIQEGQP